MRLVSRPSPARLALVSPFRSIFIFLDAIFLNFKSMNEFMGRLILIETLKEYYRILNLISGK